MKKNIDLIIDGIAPEKVMYDTDNHSLVVLYPAQEEFKRGDILASETLLLIFDEYVTYNKEKDLFHSIWNNVSTGNRNWTSKHFVHATDEQKAQVYELLRKEGKKWNAEALEIEDLDVNEIVYNLSSACNYLNKPVPDFKSLLLTISNEDFHKFKAQITLQLIREAWNKHDGFEVDYANSEQDKYFPVLDVYGDIKYLSLCSFTHISTSCYSFKTKARALQFGNQFKDLLKEAMGL